MEVALSPWLAFFTRGHTLYRTIQAQRVVFKDGKNGADLEDVCPLILSCIGFTGHPPFGAFLISRKAVCIYRDSSVVLEKDAWYFGCSFL